MISPMIVKPEVRQLIDFPIDLGESPCWDDRMGDLWFVDILAPAAFCLRSNGRVDRFNMPATIGSLALCESGEVLVALQTGIYIMDPVTGKLRFLCDPDGGRSNSRLNDGKVGPDGCFWVGTRDEAVPQTANGRLYRVAPNGSCTVIAGGLLTSNGLSWSPDGRTMYHSDSSGLFAQVFDFDPQKGVVGDPRRLRDFPAEEGRPDGASVDTDGFYWIAGGMSGGINRLSPSGEVVEIYRLPVTWPTMPCFGGSDLSTLFVTTHGTNHTGRNESGTLLAFESGFRGMPGFRFGV